MVNLRQERNVGSHPWGVNASPAVDVILAPLIVSAVVRRLQPGLLVGVLLVAWGCSFDRHDFGVTPLSVPITPAIAAGQRLNVPEPVPTATRTPAARLLYIARAGRDGIVLRAEPGQGERIGGLSDGIQVTPLGEEVSISERAWLRVRDQDGRIGWIAAEFTSATPPARSPTPTPTPRPPAKPGPTKSTP